MRDAQCALCSAEKIAAAQIFVRKKAAETEKTVECGAQSALGNGMPPAISAHTVQHGVQRGNMRYF